MLQKAYKSADLNGQLGDYLANSPDRNDQIEALVHYKKQGESHYDMGHVLSTIKGSEYEASVEYDKSILGFTKALNLSQKIGGLRKYEGQIHRANINLAILYKNRNLGIFNDRKKLNTKN